MPEPIYWREKILVAKIETTYGVDAAPSGAEAILAKDIRLMPMEGNDIERDLELPWDGNPGTIPADLHSKISFDVELEPSGTAGTAPGWGVLLRMASCAQTIAAGTSVTYNKISSGRESGTIHLLIGDTLYALRGSRGNCKIDVSASGIPYLKFEFTGLWTKPAESTRPTPVLTGFKDPSVATSTNTPAFTIDGTSFVLRSLSLDFGNKVEPRFLIGDESVIITEMRETIEAKVVAQPISTFDPFALARDATQKPLVLTHGTTAGRIASLSVPTAQMQRVQGLENAQNIKEWPLRLLPRPAAGNDQFTLTLT
ncbi:phage tail tube protein [Thalassovita sp.]|uniref:phage tail tube protein n=1 Tax=Thalassovita sp. TaxID=1979401 RepID=UPI002B26E1FB|nr:phage tail tube protein [Thalassovita sp.]